MFRFPVVKNIAGNSEPLLNQMCGVALPFRKPPTQHSKSDSRRDPIEYVPINVPTIDTTNIFCEVLPPMTTITISLFI